MLSYTQDLQHNLEVKKNYVTLEEPELWSAIPWSLFVLRAWMRVYQKLINDRTSARTWHTRYAFSTASPSFVELSGKRTDVTSLCFLRWTDFAARPSARHLYRYYGCSTRQACSEISGYFWYEHVRESPESALSRYRDLRGSCASASSLSPSSSSMSHQLVPQ